MMITNLLNFAVMPDWVLLARGGEGVICFIFAIGMIVLGVFLLSNAAKTHNSNSSFTKLARYYNGRVQRGGVVARTPRVTFAHRGVQVRVSRESGGITQVAFDWPHADYWCVITPYGLWDSFNQLFTGDGISTGNRSFDQSFLVRGNNRIRIREFLTGAVQRQLFKLRGLIQSGYLEIVISKRELQIRKKGRLDDFVLLKHYVGYTLELYDRSMATQLAGEDEISFVEQQSEEEELKTAPICQVCGDEILEQAVCCVTCDTQHHRECWTFNGRCSIYGCGQVRFYQLQERE